MDSALEGWTMPEAFQELVQDGDFAIVGELLAVFRRDTEKRLREARNAIANGDAANLQSQIHSTKGSARQMGANVMGEICQEIELTASAVPIACLSARIDELEVHFVAVCQAMRTFIDHKF